MASTPPMSAPSRESIASDIVDLQIRSCVVLVRRRIGNEWCEARGNRHYRSVRSSNEFRAHLHQLLNSKQTSYAREHGLNRLAIYFFLLHQVSHNDVEFLVNEFNR